ncbi:hypothetical protein JZ751_004744 [Albula glossodonta]|uniref:Uncharacterized protein n=1 Tax=Albula glossodonta TaxID=121402 RepID=A0A8T2NCI4_9TELE|nr:hypothetical protein JZ751_004744 [Albula glossodonta]
METLQNTAVEPTLKTRKALWERRPGVVATCAQNSYILTYGRLRPGVGTVGAAAASGPQVEREDSVAVEVAVVALPGAEGEEVEDVAGSEAARK